MSESKGVATNHLARRAIHLRLRDNLRDRKRLRKARAEIHAAMGVAKEMVENSKVPAVINGPFRAPDVKDNAGWQVWSSEDVLVHHASSRDKARAWAKETDCIATVVDDEVLCLDDAMSILGFQRIGHGKDVLDKFERTSA